MGGFLKRLRRKPTEPRGYVSYDDYMKQPSKVRRPMRINIASATWVP